MEQIHRDPPAAQTALEARARMMGRVNPAECREEMTTQALGEPAGRAIHLRHKGQEASRLWGVFSGLTACEARYAKIVLGVPIHAKVAKIEFMPERMETDADDDLDLRDEDEKHRDAVNAWMRWRGFVQHLTSANQSAIWAVVRQRSEPVNQGVLTPSGTRFLDALELLADVVDRQG